MATNLTPYALAPDEGEALWGVDGALTTVKASAEQTGAGFSLVEEIGQLSEGTPLHRHPEDDETFYVLEGELTFYVGDETYEATPGTFVYAPRGVPHSYTFETEVIRMLVLVAPGGFEEFFRDPLSSEPARAAELPPPAEGPPDVGGIVAALEGHGIEVVGPPGPPE